MRDGKKAMKLKQQREPKFPQELIHDAGYVADHANLRKFGICRICFRELAYKGEIPGVKASW